MKNIAYQQNIPRPYQVIFHFFVKPRLFLISQKKFYNIDHRTLFYKEVFFVNVSTGIQSLNLKVASAWLFFGKTKLQTEQN